uniref:NADH-ubiquinone oxidoreductase chain 2 n=1 Tax=Sweltsa longistyla TaxID=1572085 RepID=A0A0C4Y132_9NEOP|nr:NADH dehydrogenase subunit 2 [Sweltsa longistyla]
MFNNPTKFLFIMTLMSGTLITVSANSWFGAWMGLEINLLSFIPLMSTSRNLFSNEASLKYFLIQALASATLLFAVILTSLSFSLPNTLEMSFTPLTTLINSSLMLKMGAAPFHFWFPGVMEGLSWMNGLTLMTWQKIAPLMLLSYNLTMNTFISLIIVSSVIIGSLGGLTQTSLRKILAYLLLIIWDDYSQLYFYEKIFEYYMYLLMYFYEQLLSSHLMPLIIHLMYIKFFPSTLQPPLCDVGPILPIVTTLLSLGGLPPFLGFLPKWLIIQSMVEANLMPIITTMVIMTLITLFYYLRLSFGAFMLTYSETLWNFNNSQNNLNHMTALNLAILSILGLPLSSLLYWML